MNEIRKIKSFLKKRGINLMLLYKYKRLLYSFVNISYNSHWRRYAAKVKWSWRICDYLVVFYNVVSYFYNMSSKYKFADNDKLYFVSFAVTNWIDLFIRETYKEEILKGIRYCQTNKGLELYGWCIMTSHVHLIIGTKENPLQNIMRDLKRHTSEVLHKSIQK